MLRSPDAGGLTFGSEPTILVESHRRVGPTAVLAVQNRFIDIDGFAWFPEAEEIAHISTD
jgi:hypothetical protein